MTKETLEQAKEIEQEIESLKKVIHGCTYLVDGCVSALVSFGEDTACSPIKLSQDVFSQSEIKERASSRISELQKELDSL